MQVSVGQLIRVANNIGASTSEVEDSYKCVVADIKSFCQAAKVRHLPRAARAVLIARPADGWVQ